MREINFQTNYIMHPDGSCLASYGDTKVICTAIISNDQPPFLRNTEKGWLTAEYAMLPGSTGGGRKRRETGKKDGRSTEIQRLIGRSLRAAINLDLLGPRSIHIDCDVLQADGGTRTAAISGGWVALYIALSKLAKAENQSGADYYLLGQAAAVSVGIVEGDLYCDLDYIKDSNADVDMNVVMLDDKLIEVQGTGEKSVFSRQELNNLLDSAEEGVNLIRKKQIEAIASFTHQN